MKIMTSALPSDGAFLRIFFHILILLVLLFHQTIIQAQRLEPSVLANGGGVIPIPQMGTLTWTLGELIVDQIKAEGLLLTQGFQQPELKVITSYENPDFKFNVRVYPNPSSTSMVIDSDYQEELHFRLTDILGHPVKEGNFINTKNLEIDQMPSGHYILVVSEKNRLVRSFKLEKIH